MKQKFLTNILTPLLVIAVAVTLALPVSAGDNKDKKAVKKKITVSSDVAAVSAAFNAVLEISARAVSERSAIIELERYFDPDVTIVDNSGLTKGWETYKTKLLDAQLNTIAGRLSQNNHRVSDVAITVNGDTAWITYQYKLTATVQGQPFPVFGHGTTVMTRSGSGWRVVHTQNAGRKEQSYDPQF